jgi:hypothetical protein
MGRIYDEYVLMRGPTLEAIYKKLMIIESRLERIEERLESIEKMLEKRT